MNELSFPSLVIPCFLFVPSPQPAPIDPTQLLIRIFLPDFIRSYLLLSPSFPRQTFDESSTTISTKMSIPTISNQGTAGRIWACIGGFYEAFFYNKPWYESVKQFCVQGISFSWPVVPSSSLGTGLGELNAMMTALQSTLNQQPRRYHAPPVKESGIPQTSFWLAEPDHVNEKAVDWSEVMMIGEIDTKADPQSYPEGFEHLVWAADKVFKAQPTRRFLHGIYIHNDVAEPWLFDRTGLYSGQPFSASTDRTHLITMLLCYGVMSRSELGMDTFIRQESGEHYIHLSSDKGQSERYYVEPQPFVTPRELIGKGVACYRIKTEGSKSWNAVIKFVWRSDSEAGEENMLRLIKARNVWGVIQLIDQGTIETMANVHHGLRLGVPRRLRTSQLSERNASVQQPSADPWSFNDSQGILAHSEPVSESLNPGAKSPVEEPRALSYVATSPCGRHIAKSRDIVEFLLALRDAIKAHRSLYETGRVLHRDISINNIVITEEMDSDGAHGMLIDMDAAIDLTMGPSKSKTITGTKPFMAIGLLRGEDHTYRHDLESFFYILLFTATLDMSQGLPANSQLRSWMSGGWEELAIRKARDLAKPNFSKILADFRGEFQGLKDMAEALRGMMLLEDERSVPTEEDATRLYHDMISLLDTTVVAERLREGRKSKA